MTKRVCRILLVVALVAIAGCLGAGGLGGETTDDPGSEETNEMESDGSTDADGETKTKTEAETETGALTFYMSDEPNQIGDFAHLNVTVTKVGLKTAGSVSDERTDDGNESAAETESESNATDEPESDSEAETENETDSEKGDWLEYDVDERTVDLTELQGANASALDVLDVPEGEYETVFIYVSETEGILTDGTETRVKLPSEKLKIQTPFTVEAGEEIDFVFDIAPHEAGNSGKYILKPVISQTGTGDEIEIRDVDEPADDATETGTDDDADSSDGADDDGNESETDSSEAESQSNTSDENVDE